MSLLKNILFQKEGVLQTIIKIQSPMFRRTGDCGIFKRNGRLQLDFMKEERAKISNRKHDDKIAQRIQNKIDV